MLIAVFVLLFGMTFLQAVETDLLERATVFCPRPACFRVIQRLFSWRAGVLGMHVFSG